MTALDEIYSAYSKDVYRYLYSLCRDASLSEDLTSDVFLEMVKSIGGFRAESDVKTWLFSIARHKWFGYLRKKKQTAQTIGLCELAELEPASPHSAEEQVLGSELAERVYSVINAEPERSRRTALMRIDGYSFYEIGKALGISESSARVTFFRTKEKISAKLKEEGLL